MYLRTALLAATVAFAISGPALAAYAEGEAAFNQGNYWRAYQELETPAKQGDQRAQYLLGRMYMEGRGVSQDYVQAHMWLNLATAGAVAEARAYRDQVASRMTSQQIAAAQEMARTWRPGAGASQAGPARPETIAYSVRNAQRLLNRLGYTAGSEDGAMGGSTQAAIRAYQRAKGIDANGRLTQDLFDRIAVDAGYAGNARAGTGNGTDESGGFSRLVADVQAKLRAMDYNVSGVSGRMNAETQAAIQEYEADVGLRATGRADAALLSRLEADEQKAEQRDSRMVRRAQRKLESLGYDVGSADGKMDWRTDNAVRKFQADHVGLEVDGKVDRELLAALDASLRARSGSERKDRNVERETVLKIEAALNQQGYDAGAEDGRIDERAQAAIGQYQKEWGLAVDGQASADLLAHIQNPPTSGRAISPALVTDIERELAARGYQVGTVDGRADGDLRNAVRTWQSDAQITVDGELDEALLAEIRASRATRAETTPRDAASTLIQGIADSLLKGRR
jgi:peptidoglycan hydrolase-like protein with peptidoglycan-binding domain